MRGITCCFAGDTVRLAQTEPAAQVEDIATRRSRSEEGQHSGAVDEHSPRSPLPKNNGMRTRMMQLFNTKAVPHPPAEKFEGDWKSVVARDICQHWVESQTAHSAANVSLVALSKMKALDYERKNFASIPEDQRLLPATSKEQDYYEAQIKVFLEAVGEKDTDAVLQSFKLAGTGGLHRQHAMVAATVSNVLGGVGLMLFDHKVGHKAKSASPHVTASAVASKALGIAGSAIPDPTAKAIIAGVRVLLQAVTAKTVLDSGGRRLRNAGTEEILPLGRADATSAAKNAKNMFQASHAVIWRLKGAEKNLRRMEVAMTALDDARTAYETDNSPENKRAVEEAKKKLEMVFAKACYQMAVKAAYKVSSESAKIEFHGNKYYLSTSYAGTFATLFAGLFSILTPTVGGVATGGVTIAAALAAASLYIGYQLSKGPSKDGEAKAKRAIIALSKSASVLSGDSVASQDKRAAAYKTYLSEIKKARFTMPEMKRQVKEEATASLLTQLEKITQEDKLENRMSSRENWEVYRAHETAVTEIKNTAPAEAQTVDQIQGRISQLEEQFQRDHEEDFSAKSIADAWKIPMRMRMDSANRLLKGKVARSHKRLINLMQHPSLKRRIVSTLHKNGNEKAIAKIKEELRKNLLDMFNLELALHRMKPLISGNVTDPEAIARAADALGAIEDEDVRHLFCGDAKEQVEATNKAKILTAGEAERYTMTNAGASAAGIFLNVGIAATDLGINATKAARTDNMGTYHGTKIPQFNDYKFAAISQSGAQPAAHMSAGDRAPFQKREMQGLLNITANQGNAVELRMDLADDNRSHFGKDDAYVAASLDALIAQLWNADSVPEKITLSIGRQALDGADPARPVTEAPENITVDLKTTSAYHRVQYKNSPFAKKIKFTKKQIAIGARQAAMSVAGLPAQAVAQYHLKKTRAPLNQTAALGHRVRQSLIDISQGVHESDSRSESPRITEETAPTAQQVDSDSEVDFYSYSSGSPRTTEDAVPTTQLRDSESESDYYSDLNELSEGELSVRMAEMADDSSSETPVRRLTANAYGKLNALQGWLMQNLPSAAQRPR